MDLTRNELRNLWHSALIIGTMALLVGALGVFFFGGSIIVLLFLVVVIPLPFLSPEASRHLILRMQGARRLTPGQAPGVTQLLDTLSKRARLQARPSLYRIPSRTVTAFTVGSRRNAAIAVTDALLFGLSPRELAGVLAHEVSHIRRNDVWVIGLAALMARATNLMSIAGQLLLLVNLPLLLMGKLVVPWPAVLLLLLAPGVSVLLQLALSRTREYEADLAGARLTGDPVGLASALAKLERLNRGFLGRIFLPGMKVPETPLLRTHPETRERIRRLLRLESDLRPEREVTRMVEGLSRRPMGGFTILRWFPSLGS
jgi:heat shock protein HtpX